MRRTILFTASMMVFTFASGEGLTLADVKATSAVQLSADDLKQLLPGAKVVNQISLTSCPLLIRRLQFRPRLNYEGTLDSLTHIKKPIKSLCIRRA